MEKTSALPSIVMFESVRLPPSTAIMLPVQDGALDDAVAALEVPRLLIEHGHGMRDPDDTIGDLRRDESRSRSKRGTGVSSDRPSLESLPLTPSR